MTKSENVRSPRLKRLALASALTPSIQLQTPTTIVSIGTGGTAVGLALTDMIASACNGSLPKCLRTLVNEADRDPRNHSVLHRRQPFIGMGHAGFGSVIANGREKSAEFFPHFVAQLKQSFAALQSETDARFPMNQSGVKKQTLLLIAPTSGATAGGTFDCVISAAHVAAAKTGTEELNVVLVTFGAEMAHKDVKREQDLERPDRLIANNAESTQWIYAGMAAHAKVKYEVPGMGKITQIGSDRVIENHCFDQSNGSIKLHETAHLGEMIAHCLFYRYFTAAGVLRAGRFEDEFQTNVTKQRHIHRHYYLAKQS